MLGHSSRRGALPTLTTFLFVLIFLAPGLAAAQELPPRPTAVPPSEPTAAPEPGDARSTPQPSAAALPGRITGTVIDSTDGAPVAGALVQIGDQRTSSDANGNYDIYLAPGSYPVALLPQPERAAPAQAPVTVQLVAGATVVQHLFFAARAAPAQPPAAAAPVAAPPTPATLPSTGGGAAGAAGSVPLVGLALSLLALGAVARRGRRGAERADW